MRSGHTLTIVIAAAIVAACTPLSDDSATEPTVGSTPDVPSVTEVAERQTPFCEIMLDLDDRFPDDQPIDDSETDAVLEAYRAALEVAPSDVASDLAAVIDATEAGTVTTDPTTTPPTTIDTATTEAGFLDEEFVPDDNPAVRLNEYVDFACRGNLNNPGPPPTQPGATPPPTDPDAGTR